MSTMKMLTASLLVVMATSAAGNRYPVGTSCSSGWTGFNDRCFIYVPTLMSWAQAEINCQNRGGNLASVHSFAEHQLIQRMILRLTHRQPLTWLGGSDAEQEHTWFWSDGTRFEFSYWQKGQPDNYGNAHCLAMNYGDPKKWDDQLCYNRRPFVCAKKP